MAKKNSALAPFVPSLLAAAGNGALVLTVNNRLARHLRDRFDQFMLDSECPSWRPPQIWSLDAWCRHRGRTLAGERLLLSRAQELVLWEEAVRQDAANPERALLQIGTTATTARDAYLLLQEYGPHIPPSSCTEDHLAFLRWRQVVTARCEEHGWLDQAGLRKELCRQPFAPSDPLPSHIVLAGFDELSPWVSALSQAFAAAGATVEEQAPPLAPVGPASLVPCEDVVHEVRCAARWACRHLQAGSCQVGVVVPRLEEYRPLIERIFREEIAPHSCFGSAGGEGGFNLSLGEPLSRQGMVCAALAFLGSGAVPSFDELSFLLRSPYFGTTPDGATQRIACELKLRALGLTRVPWRRLGELWAAPQRAGAGVAQLVRAAGVLLEQNEPRSPGDWGLLFASVLDLAGWPGQRAPDSIEYQIHAAWKETLLPALATLDAVLPRVDRQGALRLLSTLAGELTFQPEGSSGPLQVLGTLEAAGLAFDHLWVLGMGEQDFPPAARPNPFIPAAVQVSSGMPHACPQRELAYARLVLQRLRASASQITLSYPGRKGDVALKPSPLVAQLPSVEVEEAGAGLPVLLLSGAGIEAESIVDGQGPPMVASGPVAGGTTIFRDQALCPFRAFARHRLAARSLDSPVLGLDESRRGQLVHRALELFWRRVVSHAELTRMDEVELEDALGGAIRSAVGDLLPHQGELMGEGFIVNERQRLQKLLRDWLLQVEAGRSPFQVEALEARQDLSVGGLRVRSRLDRVDRTADGTRVLIDYKTGRVSAGDLVGERLLEPQLPLYAVATEGEGLGAVGVARVRSGEHAIRGVAREEELLPGVKAFAASREAAGCGLDGWPELLVFWKRELERLAAGFLQGEATAAPEERGTCERCDLPGLCRLETLAEREGGQA